MSAVTSSDTTTITAPERGQVERANASGHTPVMFVHGLFLLPSSWDRWADLFEAAGYAALTPGWPDDPDTVAEAKAHPEVLAGKSVGQVADHFAAIAGSLSTKPVIIGHSFGGLLAELPGRGHALIIDHRWREVADTALAFVQRFTSPQPTQTEPAVS